jgi:hypothetical protein
MKLTKIAKAIKSELALELTKQGNTLQDLEKSLNNIDTGEGVYKLAGNDGLLQSLVVNPLTSLPSMALNVGAGGGAVAGLTFDELEQNVKQLNSSLDREREKLKLIQTLTANLKKEHGFK